MATNLATGMIVRERVYCYDTQSRQVGINVVYYEIGTVVGGISDADFAHIRSTFHAGPYKGWLSSRSRYDGTGIKIVDPDPFPEILSASGNGPGVAGAMQTPTQVSGLIRFGSATTVLGHTLPPKKYIPKGRIYIPFPAQQWADDDGLMKASAVTALGLIRDTFPMTDVAVGALGTAPYSLKIKTGSTLVPYVQVTSRGIPQLFATQRRRGDFGKINASPFA